MKLIKLGIIAACFVGLTTTAYAHGCDSHKTEKPAASTCGKKCNKAKNPKACAKKCDKKTTAKPAKKK